MVYNSSSLPLLLYPMLICSEINRLCGNFKIDGLVQILSSVNLYKFIGIVKLGKCAQEQEQNLVPYLSLP